MSKPTSQSILSAEAGMLGRRSFLPFAEFNKLDVLARKSQREQILSFDNRWFPARHLSSAPISGLRISPVNVSNLRSTSKKRKKGDLMEKLGLHSQDGHAYRSSPGNLILPLRESSESTSAAPIFAQAPKLRKNKTEICLKADSSVGDSVNKSGGLAKKTSHGKPKGEAKAEKSVVKCSQSNVSELGAHCKRGSTPTMLLKKSESAQGNNKSRQTAAIAPKCVDKEARGERRSTSEVDRVSKRKTRKRRQLEGKKRARQAGGKIMPVEQADISQTVEQVKDGEGTEDVNKTPHVRAVSGEAIANNICEKKTLSIEHAVSDSAMTSQSEKESPRHRGRKRRKKKRVVKTKNAEIPSGGKDYTSTSEMVSYDGTSIKYLQESKRDTSSPRSKKVNLKAPVAQVKAKQSPHGDRNKQAPPIHAKDVPPLRGAGLKRADSTPALLISPPGPDQSLIAKMEVARIEEEKKSKRSHRKPRKSGTKKAKGSAMENGGPKGSPGTESLLQGDMSLRQPEGRRSLSTPRKKPSHQTAATTEAVTSEEKSPAASVSQTSGMSRCKTMSEILEILCKHLDGNKNKQSLEMLPVQLRQYCARNGPSRPSSLPGLPKTYQQLGLKPLARSMSSENFFPRLALQWRPDKRKKRRRHRASRSTSAGGSLKNLKRGKEREEKRSKVKTRKTKARC